MEYRTAIDPISSLTAWLDPAYPSILEDYVHTLDAFQITHEEKLLLESMIQDDGSHDISSASEQRTTKITGNKRVHWNDRVKPDGHDAQTNCSDARTHDKHYMRDCDYTTPLEKTQDQQHERQRKHKQHRNSIKGRSQRKLCNQPRIEPKLELPYATPILMLQPPSPSTASVSSGASMPETPIDDYSFAPELDSCIVIPWND